MNVLLTVSVVLQFCAFFLAIRVVLRERDWRFALLTAVVGIFAIRHLLIILTGSPYIFPGSGSFLDASELVLGSFTFAAIVAIDSALAERHLAEKELQLSHQRLQKLTARLHTVREEERASIAHEMLDDLGQVMVGLKIEITLFAKQIQKSHPQLLPRVVDMIGLVDSSMQTTCDLANKLRPSVLDTLGLVAAIEWQAETFQERTSIQCNVNAQVKNSRFDKDMATAVFRIFQESLNNVFHHSRASEVNITLRQDHCSLLMSVYDNGIGISEDDLNKPNTLGIIGMRERALCFAGSVEISRSFEGGTLVNVKMPLNPVPISSQPFCVLEMQ